MLNRIEQTEAFLKEKFNNSEYFSTRPLEKAYRLEHSYRVANIGKAIAKAEGLDEELMVIGCLLHDVSYCMEFKDNADSRNHGRYAAHIARPFVESLGFSAKQLNDVLYGIAIHVDDQADFEGELNAFTISIGAADNIDRFDAYRIFEILKWKGYDDMTFEDKAAHVGASLERLEKLKNMDWATPTGNALWRARLDFYIEFYTKLRRQLELSRCIDWGQR